MSVPKRVQDRFKSQLRPLTKILDQQRSRDVSEADTVTVVKDLLDDVLGYDKYTEVTGEHEIRGTYCDLAIQIDGNLQVLIEVKAIGITLNDRHLKQAVDYAANKGVDWVVLTNGIDWVLYHILFQKPIEHEEVARVSMLDVNLRSETDVEKLFLFTKEALKKNAIKEYRERKDATNKFMLASILLNCDDVLNCIRKNIHTVSDHRVDREVIAKTLKDQVFKREVVEGEESKDATKKLTKALNKKASTKRKKKPSANSASGASTSAATPEVVVKQDSPANAAAGQPPSA